MRDYACDQEIRMTFRSDDKTAARVMEQMRVAAIALISPTQESAGELFRIGAEALFVATRIEREATDA